MEGIEITGQLIAGESYHLHEKKPPSGFIGGRNIPFKVPYLNTAAPVQITAVNSVTDGVFMKEDFAGVELPGAVCVLEKTRPDGPAEVIERWVSTGEPKRVLGKLEAGPPTAIGSKRHLKGIPTPMPLNFYQRNRRH